MKKVKVKLKDLKVVGKAEADALMATATMKPYLDYWRTVLDGDRAATEAALNVIRNIPPHQRYTARIQFALRAALADFDSEDIKLDLPHIPLDELDKLKHELKIRIEQLRIAVRAIDEHLGRRATSGLTPEN